MSDSILESVKKVIGFEPEYKAFDQDLIMHINSTFMVLNQLGVGPKEGFMIEDDTSQWVEFLGATEMLRTQAVKSYVSIKARLIFDPPATSFVIQALEKQATEYEWRLNVQVDRPEETTV